MAVDDDDGVVDVTVVGRADCDPNRAVGRVTFQMGNPVMFGSGGTVARLFAVASTSESWLMEAH